MKRAAQNSGRMGKHRAGLLSDDLSVIAQRIYRELARSDMRVWVAETTDVYFERAGHRAEVSSEYLVGIYTVGATPGDIEDDLQASRKERTSLAMLI